MKHLINPITKQEKLEFVRSLQKTFHRKGELLLPDNELYPESYDDKRLERAAKKIFVWLGAKPSGLAFRTSAQHSGFQIINKQKTLVLSRDFCENTFVGAGLLARLCVEYAISKKGVDPDPEMTELAMIELGLGLLITNAVNSSDNWRTKLNRILRIGKPNIDREILSFYSLDEFKIKFTDFISEHQLNVTPIYEHTLPWSRQCLPSFQNTNQAYHDEDFVQKERRSQTSNRIKAIGLLVCIGSVLVFSSVLINNRPRAVSVELQGVKEDIEVLNTSYGKCMASLKQKQRQYSSNDIFMVRQLDAHLGRCTSIKNTHDYLVNSYNSELEAQGLL